MSGDGAAPRRLPTLGTRGEGWVIIQSVLLAATIAAGLLGSPWPEQARLPRLVGVFALGATGAWLLIAGAASLGSALTPMPRPHNRTVLKRTGIYSKVRHPIYGGVILLAFAWSFAMSPWALIPSAALLILFAVKARLEEQLLTERFPEYRDYARGVRRRFLPYVW
jgi:protein-S-isoprenylcysteine O-methyltransferase Ste14